MASGHVNRASRGRTHGRTDQACNVKILLANSEPSTHVQVFGRRDVETIRAR